ncbi:hypothetical protein JCGZ_13705 [Jatropha curcas]|uniref:Uncharacterized protein n=1 Tax=Jatropha curcas TaxID=180498 RepID=A0A067LNY5_JATCU|nr:hypothetical protein JCGZ_13705 [Jatropha curcas]
MRLKLKRKRILWILEKRLSQLERRDSKVEDASDVETEKLELSEEEKETEDEAKKASEFPTAQKSREVILSKIEKELIEEHNRELVEAIRYSKAVIAHNQSLIESMERMKSVNERRLDTLKVKSTPYTPTSEKPKRVKHTAKRHRIEGSLLCIPLLNILRVLLKLLLHRTS